LERFALIGTSIHNGGTAGLGYYTVPPDRVEDVLPRLKDYCGFTEMVYIATCNRVEVVFTSKTRGPEEQLSRFFSFFEREHRRAGTAPLPAASPRPSFYLRQGEQAVWHLAEVAASLDSLVLGESQIITQVKESYERCFGLGLAKADMSRLFNWALHTAKEIRSQTGISAGRVSMVGLVEERIRAHLAEVSDPVVGIVGSGPMGEKAAQAVASVGGLRLLWVNRTVSHAEDLAARYGGAAIPLRTFLAEPPACDVLVTATSAATPIFGAAELAATRRPGGRLLVIDLAVPPDTAHNAGGEGIEIVTVDDLRRQTEKNRQARLAERRKALPIIAAHTKELRDQLVERSVLPVLLEFREGFLEQNRQEIEALFDGPLRSLGPEERKQVEKRINLIVKRNAHMLIAGLKEMASGCRAEQGALCCLGGIEQIGESFSLGREMPPGHPQVAGMGMPPDAAGTPGGHPHARGGGPES
jgi:glutamyl-tRNA reductase